MTVRVGDAMTLLRDMPDESVNCCVTSPPYWGLRDYGVDGQIGLEGTPEEYTAKMVEVFREVRRVLRDDGTLWLNLGDSYAGSWGAQSRDGVGAASGATSLSAGQIRAHPRGQTRTGRRHRPKHSGSIKNTPDLKAKDLIGIPWRVAFALQADGWWLRSDIIWSKPNPMPESVKDRPTRSHEYIFLMSKSAQYYYDGDAVKEPLAASSIPRLNQDVPNQTGTTRANGGAKSNGNFKAVGDTNSGLRNKRDVWTVTTQPYKEAHFATFPTKLIEPCILAGCPKGGTVLDPFAGAGTTGLVASRLDREFTGIELNPEYAEMARERMRMDSPLFYTEQEN